MKKKNPKLRCNPGSRKSRTHQNSKFQNDALSQKISKRAFVFFKIAYAQYLQGDLMAAVRNFESGLAIFPTNVEALNWLSIILICLNKYRDAIFYLTRAIMTDPFCMNSHLTRGRAYLGAGNFDKAIDDFNSVIKYIPDNVEAFIGRGDAKYLLSDFDGAIDDYTCAAKLDPLNAKALSMLKKLKSDEDVVSRKFLSFSLVDLINYLHRVRAKLNKVLGCLIWFMIIPYNEQIMEFVELVEV